MQEGEEEWKMIEHPIFGRYFKMLADGKSKADVGADMEKEKFNPALLSVDPNGEWLHPAICPSYKSSVYQLLHWHARALEALGTQRR